MKLRLGLLLAALALVAGATAASALALVNGSPDGTAHPYVGVAVSQDGSLCSGFLVGANVFVTAAHCFPDGSLAFVSTAPAFDPSTLVPGVVHDDPSFVLRSSGGLAGSDANDLAVITLFGGFPAPYAQLPPRVGYDDSLPNNQRIDNVGYGLQDPSNPAGFFPIRSAGGAKIIPGGGATGAMFLKISSSPGLGSATCFGDSGGPNLLAGTSIAVAINSYGPSAGCNAVSYSQRLDTAEAQQFIRGFMH